MIITQRAFTHTDAFAHRSVYTKKPLHRSFYTQGRLHTEAVTHRRCFIHMFLAFFNKKRRYRLKLDDSVARKKAGGRRPEDSTQENMLMNAAGEELLHRRIYTQKLLHTHTGAFTQTSFYTERLLDTEAFTERLLHREVFIQTS